MLPLIKAEFNLDYAQAGLVVSAFSIPYALSQLPAGLITDKIGAKRMITISIVGIGICGILVGLSQSYAMMLVFLGMMGLVGGGYHPSAPPLIASTVPPNIRGKAFGFHLIGGNSSFFLAPLIGAGIASAWGWRGSFLGLAVPTILFGIVFYFIISRTIKPRFEAAETKTSPALKQAPNWKFQLVLFLCLTAVVSALSMSSTSFIAVFAQDHFMISAAAAAAYVGLNNFGGIWAGPLGGYLSDRIGQIPTMLISCIGMAPIIFLLVLVPYGAPFVVLLLLWGGLNSIRLPTTESFIMTNVSPSRRSTFLGIYYFTSQHSSGIFTPLLGLMIDHMGFDSTFKIVSIAMLIATATIGTILWRSQRRNQPVITEA